MTTLLLLTLLALSGEQCDKKDCLVNHQEVKMLEPKGNNAKAATEATFNLFHGIFLGAELDRRFDPPFNTTMRAYGDLRFNLPQNLIGGLKVAVPFGSNSIIYRFNLEKRLF